MVKERDRMASKVVGDTELMARTQRVMAAGRTVLGGEVPDGELAIDLARAIAGRLSELPGDVRLTERRRLVSLVDDLMELGDRLAEARTEVEQRLLLRSNHKAAGQAYRTGGTR